MESEHTPGTTEQRHSHRHTTANRRMDFLTLAMDMIGHPLFHAVAAAMMDASMRVIMGVNTGATTGASTDASTGVIVAAIVIATSLRAIAIATNLQTIAIVTSHEVASPVMAVAMTTVAATTGSARDSG